MQEAPPTEVNEQTNNQTELTPTFSEQRWHFSREEMTHILNLPSWTIPCEILDGRTIVVLELHGGISLKLSYLENHMWIQYINGEFCLCSGDEIIPLRIRERDVLPLPATGARRVLLTV